MTYTITMLLLLLRSVSPLSTPSPPRGSSVAETSVTILRPSSRTRTIRGSLQVAVPPTTVWSILTDYNNLATHVVNLVESRIIEDEGDGEVDNSMLKSAATAAATASSAGAGRKLKLYQKGAQKIAGFSFGASLILEMAETITPKSYLFYERRRLEKKKGVEEEGLTAQSISAKRKKGERTVGNIAFKCVDSQFFSAFDGSWTVVIPGAKDDSTLDLGKVCRVDYEVFIKPRGPVPVTALEWRIKEDVPVNLRSVADASISRLLAEKPPAKIPASPKSAAPPQPSPTAATSTAEDPITRLAKLVNPKRGDNRKESSSLYDDELDDSYGDGVGQVSSFFSSFRPRTYNTDTEDASVPTAKQRVRKTQRRRRRKGLLIEKGTVINEDNDERNVFDV